MNRRMPFTPLLPSLLLAASTAGCDVAPEPEPLAPTASALVAEHTWRRADFPLSVCFLAGTDATPADRAMVRSVVESSWSGVSTVVKFSGWGLCGAQGAAIQIYQDSSVERGCSPYGDDRSSDSCGDPYMHLPDASAHLPHDVMVWTILHQFGHALGLHHSQADPDSSCGIEDRENGVVLGPYDADSVMNMCAGSPTQLSLRDQLGAQVLYPDYEILGVGDTSHSLWTKGAVEEGWNGVSNSIGIRDVTVMPDGTLVGVGDTSFSLWTKACLTCDWKGVDNSRGVRSVAVMHDGTILGVGDTSYSLWTKRPGCLAPDRQARPECKWEGTHTDSRGVRDVAILPDGRILGVGDTSYSLWTRDTLESPWVGVDHSAGIQSVDVMPNGVILGVGNTSDSLWSRLTLGDPWFAIPNSVGVQSVAYGNFRRFATALRRAEWMPASLRQP
jgi:hypothetical protein